MGQKEYIKPQLTVVRFQAELGYTTSIPPANSPNFIMGMMELMWLNSGQEYREMESFNSHSTWNSGDRDAFWE